VPLNITVLVEDQYGNLVSTDNTDVVTLSSSLGGLNGAVTATVNGGMATFAGLSLMKAGTTVLTASASGVSGASASATVTPATPTLSVSDGGIYTSSSFGANGSAVGVDGKTAVAGNWTSTYYAGNNASGSPLSGPPTQAGTYTVTGSFTSSDPNYTGGSAQTTFTIARATATVTVTDQGGAYTGKPYATSGTVTGVNGVTLGSPTFTYYSGSTASGTPLSNAPTTAGAYTVVATYAGSANYASASSTKTFVITQAATAFSGLGASRTIRPGTASMTFSGRLSVPNTPLFPPQGETVSVTINGVTQTVNIGANGNFSVTLRTRKLKRGTHPVRYTYQGDVNFAAANAGTTLRVI
jgi:hypothetical protein